MPFEIYHLPPIPSLFEKIIFDYLTQKQSLSTFYQYAPHIKGIHQCIEDIQKFDYNRSVLVNELLAQAQSVSNTSTQTYQSIDALNHNHTFSVTTGHQLCLFTGPLYVIYKIATTIQLTQQLQQHFPQYQFVPIFWMASEDHDLNEINHFYFKNQKIEWPIQTDGTPVFSIQTKLLKHVLGHLQNESIIPENYLELFQRAYLQHSDYITANRYVLNELFGQYGLVIIDARSRAFKQQFQKIFYQDIFEQQIHQSIYNDTEHLKKLNYHIAANPRNINTFLIYQNKRWVIQYQDGLYHLKNSNIVFSKEELESHLYQYPEDFSPNVLLRPMYQQSILPNIAYIGGPAEIAYWLELKNTFIHHHIFYPTLILRPIVFLSPIYVQQKLKKLSIEIPYVFEYNEHQLIQYLMDKQALSVHFDTERKQITHIFQIIQEKTQQIDKTLLPFASAELTKTLKGLDTLEHKLNKSIKQKNDILIKQVRDVYENFFPENTMQDRIWNITYASKIMGYSSLEEFIYDIMPHCYIDLPQTHPIRILKNASI